MSSRKTIDPEEIGFSLSIEVRQRRGKEVLVDITVDEVYSHNYYPCESDNESDDESTKDVSSDGMKVFTEEELNTLIIHHEDTIEFGYSSYDADDFRKTYHFPSSNVTIKQFIDAVVDFEKITRSMGNGIDRHHTFFEGIEPMGDNGPYQICWGS